MTFIKTAKQLEANKLLGSEAHNIMLYGGSRSGKSLLILRALAIRALKCESTHCIIRRTYKDARQKIGLTSWPDMMKQCFPDVPYTVNKADWFIDVGNSRIWLAGLDDSLRREHILGFEFSTIFINEASEVTWDAVQLLRTRLAEKNELTNRMVVDLNPPAKSHWTYKTFVDNQDPIDETRALPADDWAHMRMNPVDNVDNLDENYLSMLETLGERERKRFLDGEFSEEDEGHLWKREWISSTRKSRRPDNVRQIVVAVDPSGSDSPTSDECGIVVACRSGDDQFYVLDDRSGRMSPERWAQEVSEAYHEYQCDAVIAETNFGADLVKTVMRTVDHTINIIPVRAKRGKWLRAEPVAALYDRKLVHHIGHFPELEDQCCLWNPDVDKKSPDRLDALVYAIAHLSEGMANIIHPKVGAQTAPRKPIKERTIEQVLDDDEMWDEY